MRTKMAVTIGPASADPEKIKKFIELGVSAFRINFSHGDVEEWKNYVDLIQDACRKYDRYVALIGDLPGPSIRLGELKDKIRLEKDDVVKIIHGDRSEEADEKVLPIPLELFFKNISVRDILLMDDGRIQLVIQEVGKNEATAKALTSAEIGSRKAVVIKNKEIGLPTLSSRDLEALKFSVENDFDYIGLSYVRNIGDVEILRSTLVSLGGREIGVISKIETVSAFNNLEEITDSSDALLVARGDLGMHFGLEQVPRLQELIVEKCLGKGKPVIVATQLLGSMVENPVPTRSEIVDILSAARDGVDTLMLTGETAAGKYPLEAVEWLKKIIETYDSTITPRKIKLTRDADVRDRFAEGITMLAESLRAFIAIYTKTGRVALRISRNRPNVNIYACSGSVKTIRRISILWGVKPVKVDAQEYFEGLEEMLSTLRSSGEVKNGDVVILTYGLKDEPMHLVKIIQVR
ncbi:MAG: pyruvate kinase [Nitrososphaerota archaeon]